jgi:hypothetical protein
MRGFVITGVFAAAVAHADPLPRAAFVGIGAIAGGDSAIDTANLGATLEGGVDVAGPLWLHAQASGGLAASGFTGGRFLQLRGGIETRMCGTSTCGTFGVDAGYQSESVGHSVACGESPDCSGTSATGLRVIPRVGLELGHGLRWRPGIEADLGRDRTFGVLATFACAYAW